MEPQIQYATAPDAARIAYWALGEGTPLIHAPPMIWSNAQLEWREPEIRRWYEVLATKTRLVRYDVRGNGLSDRRAPSFDLDAQVADLAAVVDRIELERFDLFSFYGHGPIAIAYAAQHPERVSRLILWCAPANPAEFKIQRLTTLDNIRELDWEVFTESFTHTLLGWGEGEWAHRWAVFLQETVSKEDFAALNAAWGFIDASEYVSEVRCPTLVMHRRGLPWLELDVSQRLAADIPGARLAILEGSEPGPMLGNVDEPLRIVGEFLRQQFPTFGAATGADLKTIVFTDIESSTALTQELGDADAQEILRCHDAVVRRALARHRGIEVKHTGDGIMAAFNSVSAALECALDIQRELQSAAFRVRIGINAGEPIAQGADLFGTAVQLAKRVCDKAKGGEVLVSHVVSELAAGKDFEFADRGDVELRGFREPIRALVCSRRVTA